MISLRENASLSGRPSNNHCKGVAVLVILLVSFGMRGGLCRPAALVSVVQLSRDSTTAEESEADQLLQLYEEMKLEMNKINKNMQVQIENLQSTVSTLLSAQMTAIDQLSKCQATVDSLTSQSNSPKNHYPGCYQQSESCIANPNCTTQALRVNIKVSDTSLYAPSLRIVV